ncbi:FUSC family protein [Maridesulfovibrio ferrireducens]|uniref:FUSC family protein n=1 Tax=Maridesulfovibrio ferrireducens TaxID=246191 RepID=UPI001A294A48|nr:FUSC family protein [Maridesulfovibrio ferrireducens]MBI9112972.1 FUSC family protein [Maridesulfovibrio ferrireducens]
MSISDPRSQVSHLKHGIKTGIAAVTAYTAASLFDLSYGYWAALSGVIVMQINVADSIRMCWYRFSGTAIGALIGILCIVVFPETPSMTLLSLFVSVGFCAYMTRYNERYRMAAITTTIVTLASLGQAHRIEFGLFRVVEISIGVASAFLVSVLIWPLRAADSLKGSLCSQFSECADHYEALMESFLNKQTELDTEMLDSFNNKVALNRATYMKVLRHESLLYIEDTDLLGLKVRTLEKSGSHLRAMLHALNNVHGEGYEIIMKEELRTLSKVSAESMRAISAGKTPDEEALQNAFDAALKRLEALRKEGVTRRFYLQKMVQFFAFYHSTQFICKDLLQYTKERKKVMDNIQEG